MSKKRIYLITLSLLLTGCSKQLDSNIQIENYYISHASDTKYQQTKTIQEKNQTFILYENTDKDTQKSIIASETTTNETLSTNKFATYNIKKLENQKPGSIIKKETTKTIDCKDTKINTKTYGIEITQNQNTTYIAQIFRTTKDKGYMFSLMTPDKQEYKSFLKNTLTCK